MDMENFGKWSNIQESKLWRLTLKRYVVDTLVPLIILTFAIVFFFMFLVLRFIANEVVMVFAIIGSFGLGLFLMTKFANWLEPLNYIEHTACLVTKLANQISFMKEDFEDKELIKILRNLKKITKFEKEEPLLFKEEAEMENKFFQQLNELPLRIFHALKNKKIDQINVEQLKKIAYYIHEDSKEKVEELDSFTKSYPSTLELNILKKIAKFKWVITNKFILIIFWILILLVSAYLVYKSSWFTRDTIFIGFMTLLSVIAYIIFKK